MHTDGWDETCGGAGAGGAGCWNMGNGSCPCIIAASAASNWASASTLERVC